MHKSTLLLQAFYTINRLHGIASQQYLPQGTEDHTPHLDTSHRSQRNVTGRHHTKEDTPHQVSKKLVL